MDKIIECKDGSIIRGVVLETSSDGDIRVMTEDDKVVLFSHEIKEIREEV